MTIFHHLFRLGDPNSIPSTDGPVNDNEECCCVFSAEWEGKRLIYAAEMTGIERGQAIGPSPKTADLNALKFVDVKIKLDSKHFMQRLNLIQSKYRNWWCQSVLANVSKIIVGARNDGGIVTDISELVVADIPNKVNVSPLNKMKKNLEFTKQFFFAENLERTGLL